MILAGAAFGVAVLACLGLLLMFWRGPVKKKGSIVITKVRFANPKEESPPGQNRLFVFFDRVDFAGPVKVTLKDVPPGVQANELTIPANKKEGEYVFRVSYGTNPQSAKVRLVVEYEPDAINAEMPLTLTIIDDPKSRQ